MDRIPVFLSSRILPTVASSTGGATPLKVVRNNIEQRLYAGIGREILWVFSSPNEPALGDQTAIGRCLREARRSQVFVCLCTGDPGMTNAASPLGICHQELLAAIDDSPNKVVIVRLEEAQSKKAFAAHPAFSALVNDFQTTHQKWVTTAKTDVEIEDQAVAAVFEVIRRMGARAHATWRRNRAYAGSRFRWASKTYSERTQDIAGLIAQQLGANASVKVTRQPQLWQPGLATLALGSDELLLTITGVPDSFGVADARKYAGYPFRDDALHGQAAPGTTWIGPLHVIGVHKGVTESQMRSHLGNADIAILKTPFGFVAQDRSQAIQVAYLSDCVEEDATVEGAAELLSWLADTDIAQQVRELAQRRRAMLP